MGTIVTGMIVASCAALAVRKLYKDKKEGKAACGGDCAKCGRCR